MKERRKTVFTVPLYLKSIALFTLIAFIATQALAPSPVSFAQNTQVPGGDPVSVSTGQVLNGRIVVPPELGTISEAYRVPRTMDHAPRGPWPVDRKTVIFIQDAHDSLEAQENIAKLIEHFVDRGDVHTVFEEGYEGPLPTDQYFEFIKDPELKRKVAYFFLDHLRIGGAEYAHINRATGHAPRTSEKIARGPGGVVRGTDWQLIGADSIQLHKENVLQYRASAEKKEAIIRDLKALGKEVQSLADKRFSKELLATGVRLMCLMLMPML